MSEEIKPTDVSNDVGLFDRFAGWASGVTGRAPFFVACVLLIVVWAPSYPVWGNGDTWQLVINTTTTIVTFLLVALLQNSQARNDQATQHKLNALADALADFMDQYVEDTADPDSMRRSVDDLRRAVGLERIESTD